MSEVGKHAIHLIPTTVLRLGLLFTTFKAWLRVFFIPSKAIISCTVSLAFIASARVFADSITNAAKNKIIAT